MGLPSFRGLSNIEPLGSGGMGTVFRAWQVDLERPVAVKVLHQALQQEPKLREQFTREAHILARLEHPGIVGVHYTGESESGPYYVMRLVEGVSVDRHLAGASPSSIATVFRSIAEALAAAHREGVLHRDVKPANILVDAAGRPILVDFGLATCTLAGAATSTDDNSIAGTPDYLAPELFAGHGPSPASDIYALGATLYTTLTGRVPFGAGDLGEKLRAIRDDDPVLPRALRPEVPRPLQAICMKAMERSPADRYGSADELARDFDRFLKGDQVQALPLRTHSMLRRKIDSHLADHADWLELGLIDEGQRANLQHAYEHLDEQQRGLLRGVLTSLPNMLLLVGILLSVFGPVLLQALAWDQQGSLFRITLPVAPLVLLATIGVRQWRSLDRRRGAACLFGMALLVIPAAFALADLLPALRAITDEAGTLHSIRPGQLWLPPYDAPDWVHRGARLLDWKLLVTALATFAVGATLYRFTRSAAFLWIICFSAMSSVALAALLAGWHELPLVVRWLLASLGSLATVLTGLAFDRTWRRDGARPFYGLGFIALLSVALEFSEAGMPISFLRVPGIDQEAWSGVFHGLVFFAAGLAMHGRGTQLLRHVAGLPLFVGFMIVFSALMAMADHRSLLHEILLVAACIVFLLVGLMLHRNFLVLPAAIALPLAVGHVSQRHVDALWAWSAAVLIGGATLVLLSFRLSARRRPT
ncbi:MAG: DUF2157 domain-containing protein [Planctomycetota bacterium]